MKKLLLFTMVLAAILSLTSCKKDPSQNKIIFGDSSRMAVTKYEANQYQSDNFGQWYYSIDLNHDGTDDVQFFMEDIGSAGLGHELVHTLKCLNENVELLGETIIQNKYYHVDSTFHTEDSISWVVGVYQTYSCEQMDEADSIVSTTEKFLLSANNANDSFDGTDSFMSTNVIIKNRSYFYPMGTEQIGNILYHYQLEYLNNCDIFPMDEEKYIGFRINSGNKTRLGWMKIILNEDKVQLLETAIQK